MSFGSERPVVGPCSGMVFGANVDVRVRCGVGVVWGGFGVVIGWGGVCLDEERGGFGLSSGGLRIWWSGDKGVGVWRWMIMLVW